eukprot:756474-Hanusia_phi.AAC.5
MSRDTRAGQQGKLSASAIAPKSPIPFSRRSTRAISRRFGRTSARASAPWLPIRLLPARVKLLSGKEGDKMRAEEQEETRRMARLREKLVGGGRRSSRELEREGEKSTSPPSSTRFCRKLQGNRHKREPGQARASSCSKFHPRCRREPGDDRARPATRSTAHHVTA